MSRAQFVALLEAALVREGHTVRRLSGAQADLLAEKSGRRTLVACARWKAASTGEGPIEALAAEIGRQQAHEAVFVALGEVTQPARALGARSSIRLLGPAQLTVLLGRQAPGLPHS